jgi:hypothetical protein
MMVDRRPAGGRSGRARHGGRPASGGWQADGHTHCVEPLYTLSDEYNHRFFGLEMYQNAVAPMLLNFLVEVAHPARVIEIGTSKGGLSFCSRSAANCAATTSLRSTSKTRPPMCFRVRR